MASEPAAMDRSRRLLLVDDEPSVLVGVTRYLTAAGYDVDAVSERAAAEALLATRRYDVMVFDLGLTPGKGPDGLELVRLGRRSSPQAWILVLTAFGREGAEEEARARGANAFLQKPTGMAEILRNLRGRFAGGGSDAPAEDVGDPPRTRT